MLRISQIIKQLEEIMKLKGDLQVGHFAVEEDGIYIDPYQFMTVSIKDEVDSEEEEVYCVFIDPEDFKEDGGEDFPPEPSEKKKARGEHLKIIK